MPTPLHLCLETIHWKSKALGRIQSSLEKLLGLLQQYSGEQWPHRVACSPLLQVLAATLPETGRLILLSCELHELLSSIEQALLTDARWSLSKRGRADAVAATQLAADMELLLDTAVLRQRWLCCLLPLQLQAELLPKGGGTEGGDESSGVEEGAAVPASPRSSLPLPRLTLLRAELDSLTSSWERDSLLRKLFHKFPAAESSLLQLQGRLRKPLVYGLGAVVLLGVAALVGRHAFSSSKGILQAQLLKETSLLKGLETAAAVLQESAAGSSSSSSSGGGGGSSSLLSSFMTIIHPSSILHRLPPGSSLPSYLLDSAFISQVTLQSFLEKSQGEVQKLLGQLQGLLRQSALKGAAVGSLAGIATVAGGEKVQQLGQHLQSCYRSRSDATVEHALRLLQQAKEELRLRWQEGKAKADGEGEREREGEAAESGPAASAALASLKGQAHPPSQSAHASSAGMPASLVDGAEAAAVTSAASPSPYSAPPPPPAWLWSDGPHEITDLLLRLRPQIQTALPQALDVLSFLSQLLAKQAEVLEEEALEVADLQAGSRDGSAGRSVSRECDSRTLNSEGKRVEQAEDRSSLCSLALLPSTTAELQEESEALQADMEALCKAFYSREDSAKVKKMLRSVSSASCSWLEKQLQSLTDAGVMGAAKQSAAAGGAAAGGSSNSIPAELGEGFLTDTLVPRRPAAAGSITTLPLRLDMPSLLCSSLQQSSQWGSRGLRLPAALLQGGGSQQRCQVCMETFLTPSTPTVCPLHLTAALALASRSLKASGGAGRAGELGGGAAGHSAVASFVLDSQADRAPAAEEAAFLLPGASIACFRHHSMCLNCASQWASAQRQRRDREALAAGAVAGSASSARAAGPLASLLKALEALPRSLQSGVLRACGLPEEARLLAAYPSVVGHRGSSSGSNGSSASGAASAGGAEEGSPLWQLLLEDAVTPAGAAGGARAAREGGGEGGAVAFPAEAARRRQMETALQQQAFSCPHCRAEVLGIPVQIASPFLQQG